MTPDTAAASRFKCCSCCASGNTQRCGFDDGPSDDHASPCHKCEPAAYEAFIRIHVDPEALHAQIVGDLQTGEVYEEPLPPPVTPEEFINAN